MYIFGYLLRDEAIVGISPVIDTRKPTSLAREIYFEVFTNGGKIHIGLSNEHINQSDKVKYFKELHQKVMDKVARLFDDEQYLEEFANRGQKSA